MKYSALLLISALLICAGCENLYDIKNVSYKDDIQPILNDNCVICHSSELESGNINFETYADLMNSRYFNRNTPVAIAGSAEESRLYLVVHSNKKSIVMPPPNSGISKLSDFEITKIKVWINEGANNN